MSKVPAMPLLNKFSRCLKVLFFTIKSHNSCSGVLWSAFQFLAGTAAASQQRILNPTDTLRYILRMERIPRPGSRDAAFFMHGVLDTSMAWVSAGACCCVHFVCPLLLLQSPAEVCLGAPPS